MRIYNPWRVPSAEELAQKEIDETRRQLLEMQRKRDYYNSMVSFCNTRLSHLNTYLRDSLRDDGDPQ
jgi:chromosome condensin MukBEF ATPase and DNA-binding subunit MukB